MSKPPIVGPLGEPNAHQYTPAKLSPTAIAKDVDAAKELLGWLRWKGIRCELVQVGSIRLVGVVDDYPRKQLTMAMNAPAASDIALFDDD